MLKRQILPIYTVTADTVIGEDEESLSSDATQDAVTEVEAGTDVT